MQIKSFISKEQRKAFNGFYPYSPVWSLWLHMEFWLCIEIQTLTQPSLSISLLSPGGSESSWDKEKLQSPPSSGAQHGLAHAGLSAQHGLSGSHLSSLQQSHLLANRESFIHHIHSFTWSPAPGLLILLRPTEPHVVLVIILWFGGSPFWFALTLKIRLKVYLWISNHFHVFLDHIFCLKTKSQGVLISFCPPVGRSYESYELISCCL